MSRKSIAQLGKQHTHSTLKQAVAAEAVLLAEIGDKTGVNLGQLDSSGLGLQEPDWEIKIRKTTNQQINDILQQVRRTTSHMPLCTHACAPVRNFTATKWL